MRTSFAVLVFTVSCLSLAVVFALPPAVSWHGAEYVRPKHYLCYRAQGPIFIDGKLDEPSWKAAEWTDDFVDIEGHLKPLPRFRTRAKMLWDDEYFYISAYLDEPHVWGTLTEHDSVIFLDNDFEVFIDPDGDNDNYYEFEINVLNTGWDLLLARKDGGGREALMSWEIPGLKTATHVDGTLNDPADTDRGWSVEMAFPWKVLDDFANRPAPPRDGDQWRVNFSRVEWEIDLSNGQYQKVPGNPEDNWVWTPQWAVNMHRPETWGFVQFSTGAPGMATYRPDPADPARYLLHRVFYAQRAFRETHGRWARSLTELGLQALSHEGLIAPVTMEVTRSLWQATAEVKVPGEENQVWHLRQDCRVWRE